MSGERLARDERDALLRAIMDSALGATHNESTFPAVERILGERIAAAKVEGAREAFAKFADEHERIADSLAITFQDPRQRERATWPHRWLVHLLRAGLREPTS